jgi:DsbC/DsbD-like thiol-disulfide interchange protein
MRFLRIRLWVFSMCLGAVALAQKAIQPVQWTGSIASKSPVDSGRKAILEVSADIQDGWHVYGLNQGSGGPTPLHVTLDANDTAQTAGAVSGTPPVKKHDTSFDTDTEVYTHSFILQVPVQVNQHLPAGKRDVFVSVRFQACSDRVCLPPRTVHVPVPIEIESGS